jgi:hypothetical protein
VTELFAITLADQIACVERELRLRHAVYPRLVAQKRMKQSSADREIALMEVVLATLTRSYSSSPNPPASGSRR